MTVQRDALLCRYHYDPLDRVASCVPLNEQGIQRYYRKERFATEVQGQVRYSLFEHEAQVLVQQRHEPGRVDSALLGTDLQRSVLHAVAVGQHQQPVYSPYGHQSPDSSFSTFLGFNGERRDPVTGHYLLGKGYRAFNPVLMRFNSPDNLSPFGRGGVNAYAYCLGDPVNLMDPMGGFAMFARGINQLISASASAWQQARVGLSAMKKTVKTGFVKVPTPTRPVYGPLSVVESGREGLTRVVPQANWANEIVDEFKLLDVGFEFRSTPKPTTPPLIAKFAESKGYSEKYLFDVREFKNDPAVQKQYFLSRPVVRERLRQADADFLVAEGVHKKKYPGSTGTTEKLVGLIRES